MTNAGVAVCYRHERQAVVQPSRKMGRHGPAGTIARRLRGGVAAFCVRAAVGGHLVLLHLAAVPAAGAAVSRPPPPECPADDPVAGGCPGFAVRGGGDDVGRKPGRHHCLGTGRRAQRLAATARLGGHAAAGRAPIGCRLAHLGQ